MSAELPRSLVSLEYKHIVQQLSSELWGKHFSKFQLLESSTESFRMKIGPLNICIIPGRSFFKFSKESLSLSTSHNDFTRGVEKVLDNHRVVSFAQLNSDRIIYLEFPNHQLIFEMFGKGNILLIEKSTQKIILCYREETWRDRALKHGLLYKPPRPQMVYSTFSEFRERLRSNKDDYVIVALSRFPIGSVYGKLALALLGIDERANVFSLSENQLLELYQAIEKLQKQADYVLTKDNFYFSFPKELDSEVLQRFRDPWELLTTIYSNTLFEDRSVKKREHLLREQKRLTEEEQRARKIAETIYSDYAELEYILKEIKNKKQEGRTDNYIFLFDRLTGKVRVKKQST